jgi:transcriptional antiterminator NusG
MSEQIKSIQWFAVQIRTYHRANVETSLRNKGYEVFAPSYDVARIVAGRERKISAPLFPGYIMSAFDPGYRLPVLTVPGVIRILGTSTALTPIPEAEIEAIRRTITSGLNYEPIESFQPGAPVQVLKGPLAGIRGEVVYHKGKQRLVIKISALNDRAVSVEVDQTIVARLDSPMSFTPGREAGAASQNYQHAA